MRIRGFAALYASATTFAFVSLAVKLASGRYSGLFVSGARFAIGIVLCLSVLALRYGSIRPVKPRLVILRGVFGAGSMAASYAAISLTGPGRATLLSNSYPLFVALFGALFFGEALKRRTLASVALCLAGAALVVRDGSGAALAGDLLALGSAVLAGVAVNIVRRASAYENPFVLYLSPCVFGLPVIAFAPAPPDAGGAAGMLLLLAVGGGAFVAQALMTYGYRSVPAGRGSVVFYWETALTVALGALLAGERFNLRALAGLCLLLAGLWINRERKDEREPRPQSSSH